MSSRRSIPTEDRISILPDSVICHILSFLSTKQSVATTILSKRWKPLWLSVLTLDFDEQNFPDFATFRHFIYSVMLLRNITLPTRSLLLKCGNSLDFNPHDVSRFIQAVVQRGIQNLNLDLLTSMFNCFKLPECVLTCNSLTVLKLKRVTIVAFSEVNLPLLKTLHLENTYFSILRSSLLMRFLRGCPVLEDLHIQDVLQLGYSYGEFNHFNGLLKLVKANIFNSTTTYWNFPFAWVRNAKFLCVKLNSLYNRQVPAFLNLTNLKIIFGSTKSINDWVGKWKWVKEVLQNCPKLQNLTIHEDSSNRHEIGDDDWVDPSIVPECLSSELRTCSLIAYKDMKCEFQFAEYILKNAKALQTMKISPSDVDLNLRHQMLLKLSLCPRGSTTCKLSFD